ncbi:MAG: hypothetical protein ACI97A_000062 [Planctomycetota bacterium]|jgi:hypothetical protein
MSETEKITSKEEVAEEVGAPAFEDLPEWFQAEIKDENMRREVIVDTRDSLSQTFKRNLVIFGACLNVVVIWVTSNAIWGELFLMAAAGALCAYICLRLEASEPTGVLIAGACNLPAYFLARSPGELSGMDVAPYFFTCVILLAAGGILSYTISSERAERLPF